MKKIKYSDLPLVSLDTMNEVHFEEVAMINTLLGQLENNADFDTISNSLEMLLVHMQEHFSGEEKMMLEARYPTYRLHKGEHDKILNEARYIAMEWRNRRETEQLREYFEEDIAQWLDQHIKAMDTPMAEFIMTLKF
ncbi:MAG: hemerythrin [Epsilonproteobacteria bacterium]|nr:MAG: hemerythrin [Campylobacterota bacterium]